MRKYLSVLRLYLLLFSHSVLSNSLWFHGLQYAQLPCPSLWSVIFSVVSDSLQTMDHSPPGSSVHGIPQARILEWIVIHFCRGYSQLGIEPKSPALQADSLPSKLQGSCPSLLLFAQTHVHWINDAIQPSPPLSPISVPVLYLFQHQGLFQCFALYIRWPKYWSFSFSSSPSNEYSGLISSRIKWFDLLAVQVTLMSLLQHHNLKTSIHQPSDFFMN